MKIYIEKENTLQIDENTSFILLNANEFVSTITKQSLFVPARHIAVTLKYKLVSSNKEYLGKSVWNSYTSITNSIDTSSPYTVELVNFKLADKEEKYFEFNFKKNN